MGLYEDAMQAVIKRKQSTRERINQNLNAVIDWLDFTESLSSLPSNKPNSGGSPVGEKITNFYGGHQNVRNIMEGRGPSTGPIPPQMTWKFRGMPVTTAKGTKKYFKPFLRDLAKTGYDIESLGGYNYRPIRGGGRLSEHAYGRAIDINPQQNPMGSSLVTNMPKNVARLAALHHLIWGGTWRSKKDPMHFSITGY